MSETKFFLETDEVKKGKRHSEKVKFHLERDRAKNQDM